MISSRDYSKTNIFDTVLKALIFSILFGLVTLFSYGQEEYAVFKNLEAHSFGVNKFHNQIWQNDGSFWAISDSGLLHHNGYKADLYSYQSGQENGPVSENILVLHSTQENEVWLSYGDTSIVSRVNTKTKLFEHFQIDELLTDGKLSALVTKIVQDDEGQLWVSTWGTGLIRFYTDEPEKNETYLFPLETDTAVEPQFIKDFLFLEDGRMLVTFFCERCGERSWPVFFDPKTRDYDRIDVEAYTMQQLPVVKKQINIAMSIVHFVHEDVDGNFWFGTYSGLLFMDRQAATIQRINEEGEDVERMNQVNTMSYVHQDNQLWIQTPNRGVMIVNTETKGVHFLVNHPKNPRSLSDNKVTGLSIDPMGNFWVTSGIGRISIHVPFINRFNLLFWNDMNLEFSNRSDQNIPVNQLYVKSSNEVYISSATGLYRYNYLGVLQEKYEVDPAYTIFKHKRGVENFKVYEDKILLINDYMPHDYHLSTNRVVKAKWGSHKSRILFRHDPTFKGEIIFHYGKYGTTLFDCSNLPKMEQLVLFKGLEFSERFSFVTNNGNWLVSEANGRFILINPADTTYELFRPSDPDHYFPDSTIQSALVMRGDEILFGTSNGLYSFNEKTFESELISENPGLRKGEGVYTMLEDDNGKIWMALSRELICWDPETNQSVRYNTELGIDVSRFLPAIGQKDELGNIYLVSMYGLLVFNPDQVALPKSEIQLSLSEFILNDKTLGDQQLMTISGGKHEFHWTENFLEFHFSTNQIYGLESHEFRYKLIGLNNNWVNNGPSPIIRFDNLQHGSYELQVVVENSFGTESAIFKLPFIVKKPFWLTSWFIILMALLVIGVVYLIVRVRIRTLRRRSEMLEETVKERTSEVVEQKKEAERQKAEAEHQKEIVEEKQQEITDSITYAKRIQDAILPSDELIKQLLPESFVMYRPKDIVAGDFYWFEQINEEELIIAAADCTGHGVPGAMVSVVCNNAMNRTVREFGITDPGALLDKTKELVINQFEQSGERLETTTGETIRDGMDISICKIHLTAGTISWAGANNPIWIIRNDELIEIKGNKQPVGKFEPSVPFVTHNFPIEQGDQFYLFSDGYADQFGGEKGKKFKSASLKKLLLSIHQQSISEQLEELEKNFDDWKSDYEQLDDVCVIGFRLK